MAWTKVPSENIERLISLMSGYPDAVQRMMFGCPVFFINGNMCLGAYEEDFIIRLPVADHEALLSNPAITRFAPMGRPMREYLSLPPRVHQDTAVMATLIERAVSYVRSLPSPPPKRSRTRLAL
jgi:hypothetical protein